MSLGGRKRLWLACAATAALVLPLGWMWQASLLPDSYDMAAIGYADYGGGPTPGTAGGGVHGMPGMPGMDPATAVPVADLTADPDAPADVDVTFEVRVDDDGHYTVNGTSPGPVLEATVGDLVQVRLVNVNVPGGVTLHWHGIDVPNAADGVAGVTQDAVPPGEDFSYRFVVDQAGTFWYHSHQVSHEQVRNGLLGAVVVHPTEEPDHVVDQVVVLHEYASGPSVNGHTGTTLVDASPGEHVRLRVINTDNGLSALWVTGAPYRVLAVDGTDVHGPTDITSDKYGVPAGGRVDLGIVVPDGGARVDLGGSAAVALGSDPTDGEAGVVPDHFVDMLAYGEPADAGFGPEFHPEHPDRDFEYVIGRKPGFLDGRPGLWWTVNGHIYPDMPMFMVSTGDTVRFRIENHSGDAHPMHLHGHHAVVLARDGERATGSPWIVDSLEVLPGEEYEIAFLADNPGLWMDHCHNLQHAVDGLVAHLMYTGVRSSFRVGGTGGNEPE